MPETKPPTEEALTNDFDSFIEDLIPPELREVEEESPKDESTADPEEEEESTAEVEADKDEPLSDEDIEKLLSGEESETEGSSGEDTRFWLEDEEYKEVEQLFDTVGADKSLLDKLLASVSDKKAVQSSTYIEGIQKELETSKSSLSAIKEENDRLRVIEKGVSFDKDPEVITKYREPIAQALTEIDKILKRESVEVSLDAVGNAKNTTELTSLLDSYDIPADQKTKLVNHWRNFKDLEQEYLVSKKQAIENMEGSLNSKVSEKLLNGVLKNTMKDVATADKKFAYITDALAKGVQGLKDNPAAEKVVALAKNNFAEMVKAIQDGRESIRDTAFLSDLASFMIDAAHNKVKEEQVVSLESQLTKKNELLKKLASEYKALKNSARGITGKPGHVKTGSTNGNHYEKSEDEEGFKEFLSGKKSLEDFLG